MQCVCAQSAKRGNMREYFKRSFSGSLVNKDEHARGKGVERLSCQLFNYLKIVYISLLNFNYLFYFGLNTKCFQIFQYQDTLQHHQNAGFPIRGTLQFINVPFYFFDCTCSMWKIPGQGSIPHHSSDPSHCSDNARSLTHWTTRELHQHTI